MCKYFRPKEVAEIIGVSVLTVYNWIKSGIIPVIRPKRSIFISEDTINALLASASN